VFILSWRAITAMSAHRMRDRVEDGQGRLRWSIIFEREKLHGST
jgi:hypothetical protein